jgi:nucleoid-associated protein YgaU
LSSESIGIRIADGTFYPVLEQDFQGRKRLVVTTVRDNQQNVQIDFYRSATESVDESGYIGSLLIENLPPSPKGDAEIEVFVGVDASGNLNAEARDSRTGERQSLAVSKSSLAEEQTYAVPEVDLEKDVDAELEKNDELITGETYPIEREDRRRTYMVRKRSPLLVALLVAICALVLAAAVWFIYRYVSSSAAAAPRQAAPVATTTAPPAAPAASPVAAPAPAAAPAPVAVATPAPTPPAAPPADEGVWHTIKWGDTLWDISAAYYRNPWFYPRIARHPRNNIQNPDRILAGFKLFIPRN